MDNVKVVITGGERGSFDVVAGGQRIFSRSVEHRLPEPGEIRKRLENR